MMRWVGWSFVALAAACTPSEEAFPEAAATAYCEWSEGCDAAAFGALYADVDACVASSVDALATAADAAALVGFAYDGKAAADCLSDLRAAECDENGLALLGSCSDVWNEAAAEE